MNRVPPQTSGRAATSEFSLPAGVRCAVGCIGFSTSNHDVVFTAR